MQTYSHLLIGATVGALAGKGLDIQIACAFGSILPDTVMVPAFVLDMLKGKTPLKELTPRLIALIEASHSLFLWFGALVLSIFIHPMLWWLALGGFLHVCVDLPSHNDPKFSMKCGFLWPLPFRLRGIGTWDYRKGHGDLTPKPFEAICDLLLVLVFALAYVR